MRSLSRLVPGLLGLALAAPVADAVGQEAFAPGRASSAPVGLEFAAAPAAAAAPKHEHKGLMGRRNCLECQRARAMSRDGVAVPPVPSTPAPLAAAARAGHGHPHAAAAAVAPGSTGCASCEADAAAMGGTIVPGSIVVTDSRAGGPGYASVGGEAVAAEFPTGRASVGGAEPTPVGMARASQGNFTPVAANGPQPGLRDAAVVPSGMIPPAQTAIGGKEANRPKIITHLLDIPDLSRIGRVARDKRERASRESHASISYEGATGPVSELPASMVFGKGGR